MRHPRRICRQCHQQPCLKAEHQFCSMTCYRLSCRRVRPLCVVCHKRPASKQSRKQTCGRVCGARRRAGELSRLCTKNLAVMKERKRIADLERLMVFFRQQLADLDAATTPAARAKVLGAVYSKGRHAGSSAAYYRYVTAQRKRA